MYYRTEYGRIKPSSTRTVKRMKWIVCIDKENGLSFGGRRLARDEVLRKRLLDMSQGSKLWVSRYTARQFDEQDAVCVSDDPVGSAGAGELCFAEEMDMPADCEQVILYQWNRRYPADRFFTADLKAMGYKRLSKTDFAGKAHPRITECIYQREAGDR